MIRISDFVFRVLPSLLGLALGLLLVSPASAGLIEYVRQPDPAFEWKLERKTALPVGTVYELTMVSQQWQGIRWEHQVQVYQPTGVSPTATLFLWNQGGGADLDDMAFGMEMARRIKAPCAFVYHIPNQPLLGDKREDALIAETFVRYLETKDESWPLLFPMVKSLVRAMDALQAFSQQEWKQPVEKFVVSGASKRGWTTWLTAAADPRVKAIAPLVIDTLNMRDQMPHQLTSFGKYSDMVADYTSRGLIPIPDTDEARKLWRMVDPWVYRKQLELPKLLINGNNDPYWAVDALNLYWDDLPGKKWVLYVPNAGHNLTEHKANGKKDRSRALGGLAAFVRSQVHDRPLPRLDWKHRTTPGNLQITVESDIAPRGARLWVAHSATRDFRKSTWQSQPATLQGSTVQGKLSSPDKGFLAYYAELDYELDGQTVHFSTQLQVCEPEPVAAGS